MRILVVGLCGRMGRTVAGLCREGFCGVEVACGVDKAPRPEDFDIPCYPALSAVSGAVDCILDFSSAAATGEILDFALARKLPLVIASTGQSAKEKRAIARAAKEIPLFFSPNYSIGAALLCRLAVCAARTLADADVGIIETHRRGKADAPSGTALAVAETLKREARSGRIEVRSLRLGQTVGRHEVILAAADETLVLSHTAHNRRLYAKGALTAAAFLCGKAAGLYTMEDLLPALAGIGR